jgi:CelD/BcsL family acetyltransferase involved in cellulose biosynthesis
MRHENIDVQAPSESGAPRVVPYRSLRALAPLAARLDALNLASRRPSPFDTFAYLQAFCAHDEHAVPGQEPLLLVAFDGDAPVGFLPLRCAPRRVLGLPTTEIGFLVGHDNDRPRIIARADDEARCAEAFYRYLFTEERGFSLLHLNEQDAASALDALPAARELRRYHLHRFPNNPNATIDLPYASLEAYVEALSKNQRKQLHKDLRRLLAAGEVELVSSSDPGAVHALFDLYLELEQRSWKSKIGGHLGRHPERVAFFRSLLEPDQPLTMRVDLLLLSGLPIAGYVSGAFEGRLYGFEEAYDEAYRDLSPGNALLLLVVEGAIEQRYRSLNLLGNYAYYKARWLATITETHAVQLFRQGSLLHLKLLGGEALRRLRPPLTQGDVAFNLVKRELAEPELGAAPGERPERDEPRGRALAVLSALDAAGAGVERRGGAALRALLLPERKAPPIVRGGAQRAAAVRP